MADEKKTIPPEVRAFFVEIGRKRGNKLFAERGSQYFKDMAAKRKTHGRQGKQANTAGGSFQNLANSFGVSRQRIHQIIKSHGKLLDRSVYFDESSWREAVVRKYFAKKAKN